MDKNEYAKFIDNLTWQMEASGLSPKSYELAIALKDAVNIDLVRIGGDLDTSKKIVRTVYKRILEDTYKPRKGKITDSVFDKLVKENLRFGWRSVAVAYEAAANDRK